MTATRWILAGVACAIGAWSGVSLAATGNTGGWMVRESPSEADTTVVLTIPVSYQRMLRVPERVLCELRENTSWNSDGGLYGYWQSPSGGLPFDSYTGNGSTTLTVRLQISRPSNNQQLDPKAPLYVRCRLRPPTNTKGEWEVTDKPPPTNSAENLQDAARFIRSGGVTTVQGEVPFVVK